MIQQASAPVPSTACCSTLKFSERAGRFAQRAAYRLKHYNRRVKSLDDKPEGPNRPSPPESVSREPGPEELEDELNRLDRGNSG